MSGRNFFGKRPASWRPRERPKISATKVPCQGHCGKFIAANKTNTCRMCYETNLARVKAAQLASLLRVHELQDLPRDVVYHGIEYSLIWAGRGSLPGMDDTPKQLGCSLLDVSRVLR